MPPKTTPQQIGLVGLPDSGKSTLVARLYARGQHSGPARPTRDLALTFPGPAEMDMGEQSTLKEIQNLWEWISSNFDKKLKTVEASQLRFTVRGRGLSRPESFTITDLPGEVFQAVCRETATGPKKETVVGLQAKFRDQLPQMASMVMTVDSRNRNDVETVNLLESMLAAVASLDGRSEPVFTIILFTKALTSQVTGPAGGGDLPTDPEALAKLGADLRELEKRFKSQGHKWFRLVACESLKDLIKREEAGCTRWELPSSSAPAAVGRPPWVVTPYEAILELPRLMISWRRRRRLKRAACATGAVILALAAWLGGSWWADSTEFKQATQEPMTNLTRLEKYYLREKLYHPIKQFRRRAAAVWNDNYFHKQTEQRWGAGAVEDKLTALDQLAKQPRWRMVDQSEYDSLRNRLERERQQLLETARTESGQKREAALINATDPKSVLTELDPEKFARSSDARDEARKARQAMENQFRSEELLVGQFHSALANSGTNLLSLKSCVYRAKTNAPLRFLLMQERHYRDVVDLAGRITTIGRGSQPVLARDTLQEVKNLLPERPGLSSFLTPDTLKQELQSLDSKIQELQKRHQSAFAGLEDLRTTGWSKIGPYCEQMEQEMLDLAEERDLWGERRKEWGQKRQTSDKEYKRLFTDYNQAVENPEKQLELAEAFNRDIQNHAPEDIQDAAKLARDARSERDRIAETDKHARERLTQLQAKSWDETIRHCAAATRNVKQTSFRTFWEDQAKEFRAKFQESQDAWNDMLKQYDLVSNSPERQQELLRSFVENVADHAPEHCDEARTKLGKVAKEWEQIQAAWGDFCQTFQKFKADVDNYRNLRAKQDDYKTCLIQVSYPVIASHQQNLQTMETEISRYDTEAANRLAQARESMSKVNNGRTASQRLETFAAAARDVTKLEHDTHHKLEARDFAGTWLSGIQSRADNLASSSEDDAFREGLALWGCLEQFGPQLHDSSAAEKAKVGRVNLLQSWADEKRKQTLDVAVQKAQSGAYREAIQLLHSYQATQGKVPYNVHVEDANKKIEHIRTQWADSANAEYARLGSSTIGKREDYDTIRDQIQHVRDSFKEVIEVPPVVEGEFTRQLTGLNDKLLVWHKDCIDAVIGKCADFDSASKVIDRWDRLDELLEKVSALSSETPLKESHPADLQGAKRALEKLQVLRQPTIVNLALNAIHLTMEDIDAYYPIYEKSGDWPEPDFQLLVAGTKEWSLSVKEEGQARATDNAGHLWDHSAPKVADNGKSYWNSSAKPSAGDCKCHLHLGRNQTVEIQLYLLYSDDRHLTLHMATGEQTPGLLMLKTAPRKCAGDIKLVKSSKGLTMKPELKIDYRCEGAEAFIIPRSYDGLQAEVK